MAFDPSTISEIGGNTPDVAGSVGKALTLADLYDNSQLNKIKVNQAKQGQEDMTYARQVLAGTDLTDLESQNKAVAKITQRSPELGMQLMKSFQGAQAQKTDNDLAQLQLYQAKNEIIGGAAAQLKAKHDELVSQGASEQQIHDAMKNDVLQVAQTLTQAKLPNGQPLLNDQDKQVLSRGLGNGYSTSFIDSVVAGSQQGKAMIAQKLAERKEGVAEASEKTRETNEARQERQTNAVIAASTAKTEAADASKLNADDAQFMAQQYLAGDKSVMQNLGRGAQGAQNIILVRRAIRSAAEAQGLKPADVAAKLAEYNGYVSEQRTMGTQQANVEMASSEAQQMITNARQASADVPRGEFLPWNKLSQMSEKQLNDPKLASLKAATQAVINTWARAINPKGVATVADKQHGDDLLNAAQSPEAYDAVLDRFEQEAQASLAAPQSARQRLHDAFLGNAPLTMAAPGAGPAPTPGRGAPQSGGAAVQGPPPPPGFVVN